MKWTFSLANKIRAVITLLLLCGVVLFSNYRLKRLSNDVAESVQSIYEDRLLVQDLIFSYDRILDGLQLGLNNQYIMSKANQVRKRVKILEGSYLKTVMTKEEERGFISFSKKLNELISKERTDQLALQKMRKDLQRLEEIQLEEARNQMALIEQANAGQETMFYLETAILVILLIIAQLLIVTDAGIKKLVDKTKFNLN